MKLTKKKIDFGEKGREKRMELTRFIFRRTMEEAEKKATWESQCLEGKKNWAFMVRALIRNKKEIIEKIQNV